jgi:glyoxylase-like metal-dependent hydrolase (beta-lactamase superfamily II)
MVAADSKAGAARLGAASQRGASGTCACLSSQVLDHHLIDSEMEIVPGIHAISAPGHTPGHMALAIVSQGEQLLDLVDVVGHPIHLEQLQWTMRTDYQPELAARTRRLLLDRAAREQTRILAYHFDFPDLGYVQQQQNEWKWQPIVATIQ